MKVLEKVSETLIVIRTNDANELAVQTPLKIPWQVSDSAQLLPGDMVFFRPAKAGEIAEHFNYYLLKQKGSSLMVIDDDAHCSN